MAFSSTTKTTPATPSHVPAIDEGAEERFAPGEILGTFTGALRRPKSTRQGLIAQFFGENGKDADVITTFFLDRFREALVDLRIWVLKSGSGKEFRSEKGDYLELPPFRARIRNPASTNEGLVAQFFAANGPAADAANELNKTAYLDALVLVEVIAADEHAEFVPQSNTDRPLAELEEAAQRLTPVERRELGKLQKRAGDAWRQLSMSGFFRKPELWQLLGGESNYQHWLRSQGCCHPGAQPCAQQPVQAFRIPVADTPMPYVGLCESHAQEWNSGVVNLPNQRENPLTFLRQTHEVKVIQWAQYRLLQVLKTPTGNLPAPKTLAAWAMNHQVSLPDSFSMFLL